jgi:hypothetical protein
MHAACPYDAGGGTHAPTEPVAVEVKVVDPITPTAPVKVVVPVRLAEPLTATSPVMVVAPAPVT